MLIFFYSISFAFRDKHWLFSYHLFFFSCIQLFLFIFFIIFHLFYWPARVHAYILTIILKVFFFFLWYSLPSPSLPIVTVFIYEEDTQALTTKMAYSFSLTVYMWVGQFALPFMYSFCEGFIFCANKMQAFKWKWKRREISL